MSCECPILSESSLPIRSSWTSFEPSALVWRQLLLRRRAPKYSRRNFKNLDTSKKYLILKTVKQTGQIWQQREKKSRDSWQVIRKFVRCCSVFRIHFRCMWCVVGNIIDKLSRSTVRLICTLVVNVEIVWTEGRVTCPFPISVHLTNENATN